MLGFFLRRAALVVPTFVAVTFLSFLLIHLVPGDPIETRTGERGIAPERLAELRHEFGFDQPLWQQFLHYERQVAGGDLGTSILTQHSVWQEFLQLFPATVELSVCAILFAVLIGVPLGVISAVKQNTRLDYVLRVISLSGLSMPSFWLGLLILMGFVAWFGTIPIYTDQPNGFWHALLMYSVPAAAVGFRSSALLMLGWSLGP